MNRWVSRVFVLLTLVALAAILLRPVPILASVAAVLVFGMLARRTRPQERSAQTHGRERLYGAIMVLITLGVCGLLLLVGLPIVFSRLPQPMGIYAAHPEFYWTLAPNSSGVREVPMDDGSSYEWHVAISDQGFPDEPVPTDSPDELRVLLLGDSFAMGWGLAPDETIAEKMEAHLSEGLDRDVRVVNGGVVGYAPWQAYGFLMERGFAIEPDVVVLQTFPGNDIEGSLEKEGGHLQAYDPEWKRNLNLRISRQQWQVQLQTWVLWNVPGWRSIESAAGSQNIVVDALNAIRIFRPYELPEYPPPAERLPYLEPMLAASYPELDRGWALFRESIDAIAMECKARDVAFITFTIPEAAAIVDSLWQDEVIAAGDESLYDRGADAIRAEKIFAELGVSYVPMAEAMMAEADRDRFYLHVDRHFAPAGAAWTAERVAEKILKENLLKP